MLGAAHRYYQKAIDEHGVEGGKLEYSLRLFVQTLMWMTNTETGGTLDEGRVRGWTSSLVSVAVYPVTCAMRHFVIRMWI